MSRRFCLCPLHPKPLTFASSTHRHLATTRSIPHFKYRCADKHLTPGYPFQPCQLLSVALYCINMDNKKLSPRGQTFYSYFKQTKYIEGDLVASETSSYFTTVFFYREDFSSFFFLCRKRLFSVPRIFCFSPIE